MNMHVSMGIVVDHEHAVWDGALAEYQAAKDALARHNSTIYDPLYKELKCISPRPSLHFEIEALNGQVARYHVDSRDLNAWDDHWSPVYRRKAAEVRAAWLTYRSNCERLGTDAAGEESDRLCDAQCAIESTLIQMPAPDQAALLWKLEQLFGPEARDADDYAPGWCAEWMNVVMDDARRLLGQNVSPFMAWSTDERIAA
jgi:hypothetical protein